MVVDAIKRWIRSNFWTKLEADRRYYNKTEPLLSPTISDPTITGSTGAWDGFTFGSGWANYGSGWNNGQVKKVGDLVFLRGLVYRFSGSDTTIATLPAGSRPPAGVIFAVDTNSGSGRVDIDSTGVVTLSSGGAGNVSLSGIVFSTI